MPIRTTYTIFLPIIPMLLPRIDMNVLSINTEQFLLSLFCLSLTEPWIEGILLLYRPYDIQHIECYVNIESKIIF